MLDCKFESIFQRNMNFANYCTKCGELHIGFASFFLIFYQDNFNDFVGYMESHLRRRSTDGDPPQVKNIIIPTPIREVSLLLSLKELKEFVHFLKELENLIVVKGLAKDAISRGNWTSMN